MSSASSPASAWASAEQSALQLHAKALRAQDVAEETLARIANEDATLGAFVCTLAPEATFATALATVGA